MTRYHLQDVLDRIDEILDPSSKVCRPTAGFSDEVFLVGPAIYAGTTLLHQYPGFSQQESAFSQHLRLMWQMIA
jgi:hypothetical protein